MTVKNRYRMTNPKSFLVVLPVARYSQKLVLHNTMPQNHVAFIEEQMLETPGVSSEMSCVSRATLMCVSSYNIVESLAGDSKLYVVPTEGITVSPDVSGRVPRLI